MIIPKRDAKYYGAVHIDNYLTFTGFCKKVDSEEICDVDVFVDGKKIDTLKADKKIGKVEDIYDIEGHGFLFELEEKYFEKTHSLEFKASSGEELVNSKIQTIDKKHSKFNEYKFLHSLSTVDVEKIKDLYCKDAIGFLATEENLNDKDFVAYINELMVRFPEVEFNGFYFENCNISLSVLFGDFKRIKLIQLDNIVDLLFIKIFIYNFSTSGIEKSLGTFLIYHYAKIYTVVFLKKYLQKTLQFVDTDSSLHPYLHQASYFGLQVIENSFIKTFIYYVTDGLIIKIDLSESAKELLYFKMLDLALKYEEIIFRNYELNKKYFLLNK